MASYLLFCIIKNFASCCCPNFYLLSCALARAVQISNESRELHAEVINYMNRNQIGTIRASAEENEDIPNLSLHRLFYPDYNPNLPGHIVNWYEVADVEYIRTMNKDNAYFAAVFLTDEEKELPMIVLGLVIISCIVGLQVIYHKDTGEYIPSYAQLDTEPTFEEPPID